ncbi:MAG: alpha-L-fucosidase [Armatimonadetes bacterium]|nr:alpha-L-fucosidase [Armatimonadota bacterium]
MAIRTTTLTPEQKDRIRRLNWFNEARFGMFIHWGLYSILGRHEWVMNRERIPVEEYEPLADQFKPKPFPARAWAKLAREAGMKYMVMTTKHHEGFCHFNSELTDYCAPKRAAGRDLVAEYVEAARAEGLRVGFYYSMMDWHHPDGARCKKDEKARRRFVDYIHGQVRELCTNYGKVDIMWYDVSWPLDAAGWESAKMNAMVRKLQPDIIINDRSQIPEDFSTPEQHVTASPEGRAWESCMTMNDSWGYHAADNNWKTPRQTVGYLVQAAAGGGNLLFNIGPKADGSIPSESVKVLRAVGAWMAKHGEAIYNSDRAHLEWLPVGQFSVKGHTAYFHAFNYPGSEIAIGGIVNKVVSARWLDTGEPVQFDQKANRLILKGLPEKTPDLIAPVIALECKGTPRQVLGAGCVVLK